MTMTETIRAVGEEVEHLTVADRAAHGKAARAKVPRSSHGEWAPALGPPRSPGAAGGAGDHPGARAGPDPPRAHGGVPVRLLPGRGERPGRRPGGRRRTRGCGCSSAVTPTWPTSAASPHRSARWCSTSTTSTRPCPGPFEWDVKRLAASLEIAARSRGFDRKVRTRIVERIGAVLPRGDARLRQDAEPRRLVRPPRRRRHPGAMGRGPRPRRAQELPAGGRQGRVEGPAPGRGQADPARRRRAAGSSATRRCSCPSRSSSRRSIVRELEGSIHQAPAGLPPHPAGRPPPPARELPLRAAGPQGRRRRQRRHPLLGGAHGRPRQQRPALPPGEGGRGVGARALPGQERVRQPRPAGRGGPAAHAGRQRHLPRLGAGRSATTAAPRLLHPPAVGLEGLRRRSTP